MYGACSTRCPDTSYLRNVTKCSLACAALVVAAVSACEPLVEVARPLADPRDRDGGSGPWTLTTSGTTSDLYAVWGSSDADVWAAGADGTILHWNGLRWAATPSGVTTRFTGLWSVGADAAFAVGIDADGNGTLLRWDGTRWGSAQPPMRMRAPLRAVWGRGVNDVWLVGGANDNPEPAIWRWDGGIWRPDGVAMPRAVALTAVGGNASDVYAHGPAPLRRAGGGWALTPMPPSGTTFGAAFCVSPQGTVWVGGTSPVVLRLDGSAWTSVTLPIAVAPRHLFCANGTDVWAIGGGGRVARWDGARWSTEEAARSELNALWQSPGGQVWAVGARGIVARRSP